VNKGYAVVAVLLTVAAAAGCVTRPDVGWEGRRVAILGDSISDPNQPHGIYWQYLGDWFDWRVTSFGVCGATWRDIFCQIDRMETSMGDDVDAILILMGTNDYQRNRPLGNWFEEKTETGVWRGRKVPLAHRTLSRDTNTVCGCVNVALERLKRRYPAAQVVVMTPIHRAYACFDKGEDQAGEDWPNVGGTFMDAYVARLREVGGVWSVPTIDLYAESGLLPLYDEHMRYFRNPEYDRLHPNGAGHERLAKAIYAHLTALPATF